MVIVMFWQEGVPVGQTRESLKLLRASTLPDKRGFLVVTVRWRYW